MKHPREFVVTINFVMDAKGGAPFAVRYWNGEETPTLRLKRLKCCVVQIGSSLFDFLLSLPRLSFHLLPLFMYLFACFFHIPYLSFSYSSRQSYKLFH
jgi:hypothetical protein